MTDFDDLTVSQRALVRKLGALAQAEWYQARGAELTVSRNLERMGLVLAGLRNDIRLTADGRRLIRRESSAAAPGFVENLLDKMRGGS